jgi:hypothetical protein
MQRKPRLLPIAGLVLLGAIAVSAHHPFTDTYREDEQITITGTVAALVYRNPHSYIHVMAPDRSAQMHRWAVECTSHDVIRRNSQMEQALKPGDQVVVTGSPGRDPGTWRLRLRTIVRPRDGWTWSESGR